MMLYIYLLKTKKWWCPMTTSPPNAKLPRAKPHKLSDRCINSWWAHEKNGLWCLGQAALPSKRPSVTTSLDCQKQNTTLVIHQCILNVDGKKSYTAILNVFGRLRICKLYDYYSKNHLKKRATTRTLMTAEHWSCWPGELWNVNRTWKTPFSTEADALIRHPWLRKF